MVTGGFLCPAAVRTACKLPAISHQSSKLPVWFVQLLSLKEEEEQVVFLTMIKSIGQKIEVGDNEFLFVLCAGKAVWVVSKSLRLCLWWGEAVGLRVMGRGETEGPKQLNS